MTRTQQRTQFQKMLRTVEPKNLQDWLDEASKLSLEFANALEGVYCGREGSIHVELCNGIFLTMGWYTVSNTPKVEYCYVS